MLCHECDTFLRCAAGVREVTQLGRAAKLQIRRLLWVIEDVRRSLSGLRHAIRYARQPDQSVGIGVLEGEAWARRGEVNAYRIHLVNDSPQARDLELLVRGEQANGGRLEVRREQRIPSHTAVELFLVTDWERRFEVASGQPPTDPLTFLTAPSAAGSCQVTAMLSAGGKLLDELAIIQRLVE